MPYLVEAFSLVSIFLGKEKYVVIAFLKLFFEFKRKCKFGINLLFPFNKISKK